MRGTALCASLLLLGLLLGGPVGCRADSTQAWHRARSWSGAIQLPELPQPAPEAPRADAQLRRHGRTTVRGHLLTLPPQFASADGSYDLVIHFHGNPDAVAESYRRAKINAAVVIVNLGAGATRYVRRFADPARLRGILRRVDDKLAKRGLVAPHRRRLALSAWSAGYGAVMRILESPAASEVDAVLLLDALHARRMPVSHGIDGQDLAPFVTFAARAAVGDALLVISHSDIEPEGPLVSVDDCSDYLLEHVGATRHAASGQIPPTPLEAAHAFYGADSLLPLDLETEAILQGLRIRAYGGRLPEHHIAHLFQMEKLALEDLRLWWAATEGRPAA